MGRAKEHSSRLGPVRIKVSEFLTNEKKETDDEEEGEAADSQE